MTEQVATLARRAVSEFEHVAPYDLVVHRMGGDASDRSYYRVSYGAFGRKKTAVLMKLADAGPFIKSEEVTLYHDESGELPFLNIHRFLESIGLPVPQVLLSSVDELGALLLEDLGNTLLLEIAQGSDHERTARLYRRAIEQLVYLQLEGTRQLGERCVAAKQAFTTELFHWEFRHFLEYGIEARHGKLPASAEQEIDTLFRQWSEHLAALPRVFVHRDYHARNLMVAGERLVVIDFQDALLGPATYDLVSLLRDSYIDLGWPLVDELLEHYFETWDKRGGDTLDRERFRTNLWATAMQRNLKVAGRFVFIERVKHKSGYEKDIPRTLSYLAGYVERAPELRPLVDALRPYVPELA